MKTLSFLVIWFLLGVSASASWAIPSLQLYFAPVLNPGASYNSVDESWETDLLTTHKFIILVILSVAKDLHTEILRVSLP